jgi:hypothetical protein
LIEKLTNSKAEKERKEGLTLKKPKLDNYLSASIMETEENERHLWQANLHPHRLLQAAEIAVG